MMIAVNTRMLLKGRLDGIGTFAHETLQRITTRHPEHRFAFFFDRPYDASFVYGSNVTPHVLFPPARHPLLWWWWFERSVPAALRKSGADLFLSPDGFLPLRSSVPALAVIHDINFEHYPADLPLVYRKYYCRYFPRFAAKSTRIATVSDFTRDDLVKTYKADTSRIDVVGNAAGEQFLPLPPGEVQKVRQKITGGEPYFLFVSTLLKRKNIANTIRAFDRFKEATGSPLRFVFAGHRKWWSGDMEEAYSSSPYRQHIVFTGRVPGEELRLLTASAFASVYLSVFEGFGIPVLEAMQCGVPVITSNVSALPEVAGGAALLCDPFSVDSMSEAMMRVHSDEMLRRRLSEEGLLRAARYSWDTTADYLWQSIEKTAASRTC